jgi:hypothetical protein
VQRCRCGYKCRCRYRGAGVWCRLTGVHAGVCVCVRVGVGVGVGVSVRVEGCDAVTLEPLTLHAAPDSCWMCGGRGHFASVSAGAGAVHAVDNLDLAGDNPPPF